MSKHKEFDKDEEDLKRAKDNPQPDTEKDDPHNAPESGDKAPT
ncbi:hypothetical protein [Rouxiella chamberiensis]|uniref:Uncharacterized protein n=1 Tax=Rouxiella chamberiensis TaxID=1513468 RepID=A0ABY7HSJ0_9GAMM|nr:hypothetical protein [Rouxiella chamberiensis]WAT02368.1 hypothetical protein O1V66_07105 [Rouxiella chamberiensis]